jgi:hypothetical protein
MMISVANDISTSLLVTIVNNIHKIGDLLDYQNHCSCLPYHCEEIYNTLSDIIDIYRRIDIT